ncbi:annexin A1-like [Hyperolius riggenbachi]|uniref:annexin A1-like n=1 Tax=Hyperolius riggenbachi TaxID=752182 RepID=UPI0035A37039
MAQQQQQQYSVVQQMLQASQQTHVTSCTEAHDVQDEIDLTTRPRRNPMEDANALEQAITAKKPDEGTIIDILTNMTNEQRREVKAVYEKKTGKHLEEGLKKALSGKLETLMLDLLLTPAQFDAHKLKAAMKGLGTDEDTLIEILLTRSNKQIQNIKDVYKQEFKTDLEKDIIDDTSGDFQKTLLALLKGTRNEEIYASDDQADKDAKALYEAGEKKKKADTSVFIPIFASKSFPHLKKVFNKYATYSKHDLNKALDLELKGDFENCLVSIVKYAVNPAEFFAEKLHNSMKGLGTRDKDLTRIIVSRSECNLKAIKAQYKKMYKKTLREDVMADTSGGFETALVSLLGHDD